MKTVDRATRLSSNALGGFEKAKVQLIESNRLLDQHREEQVQAAIEWRKQVEISIAEAEAAANAAADHRDRNARVISKLNDILA